MSPVTSLQHSWQQQRQRRHQELAQRQQQVQQTLKRFQKERQTTSTALRETLHQFQAQLQQNTRNSLAQLGAQRQAQSLELAQQLCHFTQHLRHQTAELLSMYNADRSLMAQQITQDLDDFHQQLSASVTLLRHDLQAQIQQLRIETQETLHSQQQQRMQTQMQLMQDLDQFISSLQLEVQSYLTALAQVRQERANDIYDTLQASRQQRLADVAALFQQFSAFRAELRAFSAQIRQAVWSHQADSTQVSPGLPLSRHDLQALPKRSAAPSSLSLKKLTTPQTETQTTAPIANNVALALSALIATDETESSSVPPVGSEVSSIAEASHPASSHSSPLEQQIYQYIQQTQGSRLTEIESALSINRFQAVDALRSLIKQGVVIQRDRLYLLQQPASVLR